MKFKIYSLSIILIFFIFLFGLETSFAKSFKSNIEIHEVTSSSDYNKFSIGFLIGDYNLADKRFKKIYKEKRTILGVEAFYELYNWMQKYAIEGGISLKYYNTNGYSTVTKDSTEFSLYPLSLNLRGKIRLTKILESFIGLGLDYYSYRENCPELKSTSGSKFGFHVECGGYFSIPKMEALKLRGYLRYTTVKAQEDGIEVSLGGVELGLGIFYSFSLF